MESMTSPTKRHQPLLNLIHMIKDKNLTGHDVSACILTELKEMSEPDDRFANAICNDGIYDKNAKTTRFVLIDLERNLPGNNLINKGNPDTFDEYIKKNQPRWTIEHILPEGSLPDYWKDAISPDDREQAESIQRKYVHLIGNLTLSPYNANLKQLPFVDEEHPSREEDNYTKSKRDFKEHGTYVGLRECLRLNASIPAPSERIEGKTSWSIADIKRRTEWFKDRILERYAFPSSDKA